MLYKSVIILSKSLLFPSVPVILACRRFLVLLIAVESHLRMFEIPLTDIAAFTIRQILNSKVIGSKK